MIGMAGSRWPSHKCHELLESGVLPAKMRILPNKSALHRLLIIEEKVELEKTTQNWLFFRLGRVHRWRLDLHGADPPQQAEQTGNDQCLCRATILGQEENSFAVAQ